MNGDKQVIKNFNCLLVNEFVAANQFFIHASIFKHWGLIRLNKIEHQESLAEMEHADCYIKRIMFLEGMPDIHKYSQELHFSDVKNIEDILRLDLNLERVVVDDLRKSIIYANSVNDFVSCDIMTKILIEEEGHIDFLETELSLIMKIGIHNYLQSQLR